MNRTKVEKTSSFTAVDSDGESYEIHEITKFTEFVPVSGLPSWSPGPKEYITSTGKPINRNSDGTFANALSGKILKRID